MEFFNGLQGVSMMTDENVCTSLYQLMGFVALAGNRSEGVFTTPVEETMITAVESAWRRWKTRSKRESIGS